MSVTSAEPRRRNLAGAERNGSASTDGRFLRISDVIAFAGLSRATIYRLIDAGLRLRLVPRTRLAQAACLRTPVPRVRPY